MSEGRRLSRPRLSRAQLPAAVTEHLAGHGRVLAAARASDGTWLAGTRDALHAIPPGGAAVVRLPWQLVHRADWDSDTSTLRVERVAAFGREVPVHTFGLPSPGGLVPLVRERVAASIVLQRRVDLGQKRGLTVIGRRPPDGGREVSWAYELDPGVDPADPAVAEAAASALRAAQESLGL